MGMRARALGRPRKGSEPKRASKERGEFREAIIYMKGSPEYFEFVDVVHKKTSISKVQLFRDALKLYCETNGHGTPPVI